MMRRIAIICAVVVVGLGIAFVVYKTRPGLPTPSPSPTPARGVSLAPYPPEGQHFRFRDALDNPYSPEFQTSFSYQPGMLTHTLTGGATLSGRIHAERLKPNFAYQVKLEGMPTQPYPWDKDALKDPYNAANQQIGRLGRWWCKECQWNVRDSELDQHKGHTVNGYLLFDYFVTDGLGNADVLLTLQSSFHVLWRLNQRPHETNDGDIRTYKVASSIDPVTSEVYGYSDPIEPAELQIYAEWEPERPLPGKVVFPPGEYRCRLLLTEESFHNVPPALAERFPWGRTKHEDGGWWGHCLTDEQLSFTITGSPQPTD